jgi:hypothetical protein
MTPIRGTRQSVSGQYAATAHRKNSSSLQTASYPQCGPSFGILHQNHIAFLYECHAVFKRAQKLLIQNMLALETQLAEAQKSPVDQKDAISHYRYWVTLLELTYDSFLWIAANHDRSDLTKFFKGSKHGALLHQNIQSVIELSEQLNQEPDVFAIPLDFSRFACIGDLLRIRRYADGRVSQDFIEVKEGKVNEEIFDVLKAKNQQRYDEFLGKYGEKGASQIERVLKQEKTMNAHIDLLGLQPGVYAKHDVVRLVTEMAIGHGDSFQGSVESLVQSARDKKYSVQTIDDCLVVAALNADSEEHCSKIDYAARFVAHARFGDLTINADQLRLFQAQSAIQFVDWRSGFGSVLCIPPALRGLSTHCFLDLLFGRIRLHLHFDPACFIHLCADAGIHAGFIRKRTTNQLRSRFAWKKRQVPLFDGRAVGYITGAVTAVLSPSYMDEILFNWRMPSAVIRHIKQMGDEFPATTPTDSTGSPTSRLFSETDLECP